jgi:hypothetical protein
LTYLIVVQPKQRLPSNQQRRTTQVPFSLSSAGELGASAALASGREAEELLDELAEVLQQAGRDHYEMLQVLALPVAGSA